MLYRIFLTVILVSFAAQVTFAQAPPVMPYPQAASAAAAQPAAESVELQAVRQQVKLLEAQLQITRDFQSAILDTIYWALGGFFWH